MYFEMPHKDCDQLEKKSEAEVLNIVTGARRRRGSAGIIS